MSDATKELSIAVDTSGRIGSVCIGKGENILEEKYFSGVMKHAAEIFPTLIQLLEKHNFGVANVRNIFVAAGPGSFTGLRIGVTMAKMMALASDVKIASASTMDIVALNAFDHIEQNNLDIQRVAPIIDAKRQQFFVSTYEKNSDGWKKTTDDAMMNVKTFIEKFDIGGQSPIYLLGEGLKYYQKHFESDGIGFFEEDLWTARAKNVYKACYNKAVKGDFEDAALFVPKYLRLTDAEENLQKKLSQNK